MKATEVNGLLSLFLVSIHLGYVFFGWWHSIKIKEGTSVLRADVFFPCLKFVLEKGAAIACVSSSILKAFLGTELQEECEAGGWATWITKDSVHHIKNIVKHFK